MVYVSTSMEILLHAQCVGHHNCDVWTPDEKVMSVQSECISCSRVSGMHMLSVGCQINPSQLGSILWPLAVGTDT